MNTSPPGADQGPPERENRRHRARRLERKLRPPRGHAVPGLRPSDGPPRWRPFRADPDSEKAPPLMGYGPLRPRKPLFALLVGALLGTGTASAMPDAAIPSGAKDYDQKWARAFAEVSWAAPDRIGRDGDRPPPAAPPPPPHRLAPDLVPPTTGEITRAWLLCEWGLARLWVLRHLAWVLGIVAMISFLGGAHRLFLRRRAMRAAVLAVALALAPAAARATEPLENHDDAAAPPVSAPRMVVVRAGEGYTFGEQPPPPPPPPPPPSEPIPLSGAELAEMWTHHHGRCNLARLLAADLSAWLRPRMEAPVRWDLAVQAFFLGMVVSYALYSLRKSRRSAL